jgi:hypothetical protein
VSRRSEQPHDRLTELCAVMTTALEGDPLYGEGVKCIVFLQDGKRGGLQMHGYDDDAEAIADLFMHLKAIFEANGKTLLFAPLGQG